MGVSRREALKGLLAGGAVTWRQGASVVSAEARAVSLRLDNGLRARIIANDSRYIAAALVLRSSDIRAADGLAHILEHTSFVGAAGAFSANLIKQMHQDYIQESNASTEPGMMQWQVSFLPKYLEQVLGLLAVISLDQQCDVETVRREARVVLQELYLDRYHHSFRHKRLLGGALFGSDHPYGIDTTDSEIAKARTRPDRLASELRAYAQTIRLPANMDLFVVGGLDTGVAATIVEVSHSRGGRCCQCRMPRSLKLTGPLPPRRRSCAVPCRKSKLHGILALGSRILMPRWSLRSANI